MDRSGCCTHTVGDGVGSQGDYLSIQAAVDNLPPEGGKRLLIATAAFRNEPYN